MANDPFSPKKRFKIGPVVTGLVLILSVTFVVAYYAPLSQAHGILEQAHETLSGTQRSVSAQLKLTTTQLEAAQKERDGLHKKLTDIEELAESDRSRAKGLSDRLAKKLSKRVQRKQLTVSPLGSQTSLVIDDIKLFRGHQVSVHPPGQQILCDVANALKDEDLRLEVISHASSKKISNPILRGDYPTTWELTTARSAGAVQALLKCGVKPVLVRALGVGHHQPLEGVAKNSSGQLQILVSGTQAAD